MVSGKAIAAGSLRLGPAASALPLTQNRHWVPRQELTLGCREFALRFSSRVDSPTPTFRLDAALALLFVAQGFDNRKQFFVSHESPVVLQFVLVHSTTKFGRLRREIVVAIRKLTSLQTRALSLARGIAAIYEIWWKFRRRLWLRRFLSGHR